MIYSDIFQEWNHIQRFQWRRVLNRVPTPCVCCKGQVSVYNFSLNLMDLSLKNEAILFCNRYKKRELDSSLCSFSGHATANHGPNDSVECLALATGNISRMVIRTSTVCEAAISFRETRSEQVKLKANKLI